MTIMRKRNPPCSPLPIFRLHNNRKRLKVLFLIFLPVYIECFSVTDNQFGIITPT
jgi:hypothetical protein